MARVGVVGAGYVGLTTAACFAELEHEVVCADIDTERVAALERGEIPILEHGLDELVARNTAAGRLRFVVGAAEAARGAEVVYLCVPTPQSDEGKADLSYIEAAAAEIAPALPGGAIVVNKSTVPIGAARIVRQLIDRPDVAVVSNPEFLREGTAVHDFFHPDRIVIGADDRQAAAAVAGLYLGIAAPILVTDPASAETVKYASNAFLATKVSFANAIAAVCESAGADVGDVLLGMGYDNRIGPAFLNPGPGWGGSCLPKDVMALLHSATEAGYAFPLLRATHESNQDQFDRVVAKVAAAAGGSLDGVTVGVLGLTFKANTDDLRCSPALAVIGRMIEAGARVRAHDPGIDERRAAHPDLAAIEVHQDPYAALAGAEVAVILTEWDAFRWLDYARIREGLVRPALVDARNLLSPADAHRWGFDYQGIGRS